MTTYYFIGSTNKDFVPLIHNPEWKAPSSTELEDFMPHDMVMSRTKTFKRPKLPDSQLNEYIIVQRLINWNKPLKISDESQELNKPFLDDATTFAGAMAPEFVTELLSSNALEPLISVPKSWLLEMHSTHLDGLSDLMSLTQLSMPSLLLTLRCRYMGGEIYSGVGSRILIAINPYRTLKALICNKVYNLYRTSDSLSILGALPPHPFALAQQAWLRLQYKSGSQSIIISGESGAGKTETTKLILQYFAACDAATSEKTKGINDRRDIKDALLESNPVLEAFGNAKTQRNDNSSRFGKFIRIFYNENMLIHGTSVNTYLLEKCRLTSRNEHEGNYHVFYQVIRGLDHIDDKIVKELGLEKFVDPNEGLFSCDLLNTFYLDAKKDKSAVRMQYKEEFNHLLMAMDSLEIKDWADIFRLLASLIHLRELKFIEDDKGIYSFSDDSLESLEYFSKLILFSEDESPKKALENALCWKGIVDPEKKSLLMTPRSGVECHVVRDSLIRCLYDSIFSYIVRCVNIRLSLGIDSDQFESFPSIGLLDIYGFEVFGTENSFEQMCINYANERLQMHFNHHVFEQEQVIYENECINWSVIEFNDNLEVITALDHKVHGAWALLDSECQRPSGSDDNYMLLMQRHRSQIIKKPKNQFLTNSHFEVLHYAGEVEYDCRQFLLKNRDSLGEDTANYLLNCNHPIIKKETATKIESETPRPSSAGFGRGSAQRRLHKDSVSKVFRSQLDHLIELIDKTGPAYIRCIKPNNDKLAGRFDPASALRQLEAGGMLESVRIRKAGYGTRLSFDETYSLLRPLIKGVSKNLETILDQFPSDQWQIGRTKVFLKDDLHSYILSLVDSARVNAAVLIQSVFRMIKAVKYRKKMISATVVFQCAWRCYLARKKLHEQKSARVIQSFYRGYAARKAFKLHYKQLTEAAIVIQSNYRRHCAQKSVRELIKVKEWALRLSSAWKRYQIKTGMYWRNLALLLSFVWKIKQRMTEQKVIQFEGAVEDFWNKQHLRRTVLIFTKLEIVRKSTEPDVEISKANEKLLNTQSYKSCKGSSDHLKTVSTGMVSMQEESIGIPDERRFAEERRYPTLSDSEVLLNLPAREYIPPQEKEYMPEDQVYRSSVSKSSKWDKAESHSRWKQAGFASKRLDYPTVSNSLSVKLEDEFYNRDEQRREMNEIKDAINRLDGKVTLLSDQMSQLMMFLGGTMRLNENISGSPHTSPSAKSKLSGPPPYRPRVSNTSMTQRLNRTMPEKDRCNSSQRIIFRSRSNSQEFHRTSPPQQRSSLMEFPSLKRGRSGLYETIASEIQREKEHLQFLDKESRSKYCKIAEMDIDWAKAMDSREDRRTADYH